MWQQALVTNGFSGIDILLDDHDRSVAMASVIVSTAVEPEVPRSLKTSSKPSITIVHSNVRASFSYALEDAASQRGFGITHVSISDAHTIPQSSRIIVLADLAGNFWLDLDAEGIESLKVLFQSAASLIWVTAGGLIDGVRPEQALTSGLMRAIITEKPDVKIMTMDLEVGYDQLDVKLTDIVLNKEAELQHASPGSGVHESEIALKDGVGYVSRLAPDNALSQRFREQEGSVKDTEVLSLHEAKPLKIGFDQTGILSALHFKEDQDFRAPLAAEHVEIQVKAVGLNVKVSLSLRRIPELCGFFGLTFDSSGSRCRTWSL